MSRSLGELLVSAEVITPEQLEQALEIQRLEGGGRIGDILVGRFGVPHDVVVDARVEQVWHLPGEQQATGEGAR